MKKFHWDTITYYFIMKHSKLELHNLFLDFKRFFFIWTWHPYDWECFLVFNFKCSITIKLIIFMKLFVCIIMESWRKFYHKHEAHSFFSQIDQYMNKMIFFYQRIQIIIRLMHNSTVSTKSGHILFQYFCERYTTSSSKKTKIRTTIIFMFKIRIIV